MNESAQSLSDPTGSVTDVAMMVKLIESEGPNINRIARILHQHKETVRYRYRQRILANGFGVQAKPDYEKLGLKRLVLVGEIDYEWWVQRTQLFALLNESCYFVNFSRILPDGRFIANVSIPPSFVADFERLLAELAARKLFQTKRVYSFDSFRNPAMRAEYYDFSADRWDFDWHVPQDKHEESITFVPSSAGKFDDTDLLLVKELQVDATRSLTEISSRLRLAYKRALRHFDHIVDREMIQGYRITWPKDAVDLKRNVVPVIRHRYLPLFLLVKNTTPAETRHLKLSFERLPYLFAEAVGKDYFAEMFLPLEESIEGLRYVRDSIEQTRERADFGLIDPEYSLGFTISYQLYDRKTKRWTFDAQRVLEGVENLLVTRKETRR